MIYYIILTIILILLITGIVFSSITLNKAQQSLIKEFEKVKDMKKCPQTAKYFSKFQTSWHTWPLAMIASCSVTVVFILVMAFINALSSNKIPNEYVVVLSIFILVSVFTACYKILNCTTARVCGWDSCITPYVS